LYTDFPATDYRRINRTTQLAKTPALIHTMLSLPTRYIAKLLFKKEEVPDDQQSIQP